MKYVVLLVLFGVAAAQFQPQPFQPRPPGPPSPFDQPRPNPPPRSKPNPFNPNVPIPNRYDPQHPNARNNEIAIVKQYFDDQGNGAYSWGFQNTDGTERQEKIYYKDAGELGHVLVKEGFYTYYDTDGRLVKVSYRADENGFQILEDTRLVA